MDAFFFLLLLAVIMDQSDCLQQAPVVISKDRPQAIMKPLGKEAYVTLLHGSKSYHLELNIRVLGQSLKDTKSTIERIVLCTSDVPEESKVLLEGEGWKVRMVEEFYPRPFDVSFNKLQLWKMKGYRRVVWIDPNALVLKNIDSLFRCGNFCAVFQRSNYFSTTVMVVKPSLVDIGRILTWNHDRINQSPKPSLHMILNNFYNSYYRLMYKEMFDANSTVYHKEPLRLSAGYQADAVMNIVNSHWYLKEEQIFIIDYTLDSIHPAYWWTYPLFKVNMMWYSVREKLPSHPRDPSLWNIINWSPILILILLYSVLRFLPISYRLANHSCSKSVIIYVSPAHNGWIIGCTPLTILLISYFCSYQLIPAIMWPLQAWILYGMWVMTFLCLLYSPLCYLLYVAGNNNINGYVKRMAESVFYLIGFIVIHTASLLLLHSFGNLHKRLMALCFSVILCLVYGHFAGKRVLRIWYCYSRPWVNYLGLFYDNFHSTYK